MSNSDMGYDQDEQQPTMADPAGTAAEEGEEVTSDIGDVSGTTRPADVGATDHTRAGAFNSGAKAAPDTSTDINTSAGGADTASTPGRLGEQGGTDRTNPPGGQGAAPNSAP